MMHLAMRRRLLLGLALGAFLAAIAALTVGCGSTHTKTVPPLPSAPQKTFGLHGATTPGQCAVQVPIGQGHMGICAPHSPTEIPKPGSKPITTTVGRLFVDVYEGNGAGPPKCI